MPRNPAPTLRLATIDGDAAPGARAKGSRRPHRNETVARVRRLIETTPYSYEEISNLTGVARASICRWTRDGGWKRHLFAPRATDTIPRERAGAQLKMRTVAARLAALAERYLRELEETPGIDLGKLGEAMALYQLARFALRRRRPRRKSSRLPAHPRVSGDPGVASTKPEALDSRFRGNERSMLQLAALYPRPPGSEPLELSAPGPNTSPYLRLWMELTNAGVDLDRAPDEAVRDFIKSRMYEDVALRPKNRTRRQRYEDWMREKM